MAPRNVLFIMCDQLRFDYLGCAGHPTLKTPHIDALAARGVRFTRAFAQSTICGPSRMCAYTGRYMRTHGSTQNGMPLKVGEPTLGDHLNAIGVRTVLVGKTHMSADQEGMDRLGIDPGSTIGVHVSQCGFEPFERDDGLHPDGPYNPDPAYNAYLRTQGFSSDNPWEQWANSAAGADGAILNGWLLTHADKAARVPDEHAETPYMTRRAMDFMDEAAKDGRPWCLHLSYIKPHWPYIAPAPYHALYGQADVPPAVRTEDERRDAHPIFAAFMDERYSRNASRDEARQKVIPTYMGLIQQIDDQLGALFAFMAARGLMENTLIVFTADHGDYLGDHWLGEKYLFHDPSVRVPMIVVDPTSEADATRGATIDALVELIDLAPTFLDFFGGDPKPHILEGLSLLPLLHGKDAPWRKVAVSEYDYAGDAARLALDVPVRDARLYMIFDGRWKYIHADGFRPMLFDLAGDPSELVDRGADPECAEVRAGLYEALCRWSRTTATGTTWSDAVITGNDNALRVYDPNLEQGVLIGYWDEAELQAEQVKRAAFLAANARDGGGA